MLANWVAEHREWYDEWNHSGYRRRRTLPEFVMLWVCAAMFLYHIFLAFTAIGHYVQSFGSWAMFYGFWTGVQLVLPRHWLDCIIAYGFNPEDYGVEGPVKWDMDPDK